MAYHNPHIKIPLFEQKRSNMAINHVVLTGKVADPGPKLTYNAASVKPETRLTLIVEEGKGDQVFSLFVPVFLYGLCAERAAEEVDAGDIIAIDGRLSWKSTLKKDGSKLGLCVSCFSVEVLVKAEVSVAGAADLEPTLEAEPTTEPPAKVRRPRYPKWRPSAPALSEN
jgi:Single-strand binding protein family